MFNGVTGLGSNFSAKPIDLLAKYINTAEEDMDIEMQEPYYLLRVSPWSLLLPYGTLKVCCSELVQIADLWIFIRVISQKHVQSENIGIALKFNNTFQQVNSLVARNDSMPP